MNQIKYYFNLNMNKASKNDKCLNILDSFIINNCEVFGCIILSMKFK
jgi:hypothetical protein